MESRLPWQGETLLPSLAAFDTTVVGPTRSRVTPSIRTPITSTIRDMSRYVPYNQNKVLRGMSRANMPDTTDRCLRSNHPVELPLVDACLEDLPRTCHRQHCRLEDRRADAPICPSVRQPYQGGGFPSWCPQHHLWFRSDSWRRHLIAYGHRQGRLYWLHRHRSPNHEGRCRL